MVFTLVINPKAFSRNGKYLKREMITKLLRTFIEDQLDYMNVAVNEKKSHDDVTGVAVDQMHITTELDLFTDDIYSVDNIYDAEVLVHKMAQTCPIGDPKGLIEFNSQYTTSVFLL